MRDRPRPGRQPRVDAVTSARFKERIVAGAELQRDGVVAFRGVDAQRILKEEFEIDCSLSSTYRLLHRLKLSWLAPRPRHPEADATAQAAFSQLLDCNQSESGRHKDAVRESRCGFRCYGGGHRAG